MEAEAERYVRIEIANEDSVNWGIVTRPSSVNHFKGIPRNVVGYSEIGVVQKIGWIHPPTPLTAMSKESSHELSNPPLPACSLQFRVHQLNYHGKIPNNMTSKRVMKSFSKSKPHLNSTIIAPFVGH